MKKTITFLLIVSLIFALCGCGNNDVVNESTSFSTEAKTSEVTEKTESTSEKERLLCKI